MTSANFSTIPKKESIKRWDGSKKPQRWNHWYCFL